MELIFNGALSYSSDVSQSHKVVIHLATDHLVKGFNSR